VPTGEAIGLAGDAPVSVLAGAFPVALLERASTEPR
jgi:hypothetical protein